LLTGLRRFWLDAVLATVAGVCAIGFGLDLVTGFSLLLTVLGASFTVTGGAALVRYLHHTRDQVDQTGAASEVDPLDRGTDGAGEARP
jgi:hypothetical protein